ncbi:MAG: hypothetical protein IKB53_07955, partial [Oscillospiraceae bacterium]|nr:hypothetical protein [Oscillospiraceae bacterium]
QLCHFLETASLHPPPAALRLFPQTAFVARFRATLFDIFSKVYTLFIFSPQKMQKERRMAIRKGLSLAFLILSYEASPSVRHFLFYQTFWTQKMASSAEDAIFIYFFSSPLALWVR